MKKDISARRDEERESGVNLINNAELFRGDQPAAGAAFFTSNFTLQDSQAVPTFWYFWGEFEVTLNESQKWF